MSPKYVVPCLLALLPMGCGDDDAAQHAELEPDLHTPDARGPTIWQGVVDLSSCDLNQPAEAPDSQTAIRCQGLRDAQPFSLTVCGDLTADNTMDVEGTLGTSGDWSVSSPAHVSLDAFVGGTLNAKNSVRVDGMLHATNIVESGTLSTGTVAGEPSLPNPPDCANTPDVAALAAATDTPAYPSASGALASVSQPTEVTLGCGRYRLTSIESNNVLTLHVQGHVLLVVEGDVRIASPTRIELAPDASLDLLIAGSLQIDNTLSITGGSAWVGVADTIRVASPFTLEGTLVAPRAEVALDNTFDLTGAAVVGPLRVASPLHVHGTSSAPAAACLQN